MFKRLISKRISIISQQNKKFCQKQDNNYHGGFKKIDADLDANFQLFQDQQQVPHFKDTKEVDQFSNLPIKALDPKKYLESSEKFSDLNIDSLEQIAILTSIEEEFHTVFEDNVFENFTSMSQVVNYLKTDDCF